MILYIKRSEAFFTDMKTIIFSFDCPFLVEFLSECCDILIGEIWGLRSVTPSHNNTTLKTKHSLTVLALELKVPFILDPTPPI